MIICCFLWHIKGYNDKNWTEIITDLTVSCGVDFQQGPSLLLHLLVIEPSYSWGLTSLSSCSQICTHMALVEVLR